MTETFERDNIKITMALNFDRSVNLGTMMQVEYKDNNNEYLRYECYPTGSPTNPRVGTIGNQFTYVQSKMRFNETYAKAILKDIKKFFTDKPTLSTLGISNEAGFNDNCLSQIFSGEIPITLNLVDKLTPVLEKHGFGK